MKAAWLDRFGDPHEVVSYRDVPDPGVPDRGEVLLHLLASPITGRGR